mmetsp:Transcript_43148/g.73370  ORF Transcript_43148/g.73370 Transcript_43148/m.73370 type:complete len:107 (-) Transcript_43148:269-589(-)
MAKKKASSRKPNNNYMRLPLVAPPPPSPDSTIQLRGSLGLRSELLVRVALETFTKTPLLTPLTPLIEKDTPPAHPFSFSLFLLILSRVCFVFNTQGGRLFSGWSWT